MANKTLYWKDGRAINVTYDGDKDGDAVFSSNTNESLDTSRKVTFKVNDNVFVERNISQVGKREVFNEDFRLADGGTFNVIKEEYYGV